MVVASEVAGVAGDTFAAASDRRGFQGAVGCRVVAGNTTVYGMNLACADKRRAGGAMAGNAIGRRGRDGNVYLDLCAVVMAMSGEVGIVALCASASSAPIDCGIAMAIDANSASTVCWVMTTAASVMNRGDDVPSVAAHAEAGGSDS